ncbi:MAG: hypothetical protein K2K64_01145 [Muribaculaceae bacterium]|nr:hypothetical protein [Muribaculaceae bacterium]
MLHLLLNVEANDRANKANPDTSTMKELLHYFIDGNRLPRIHPLLYYYAGRAFTEDQSFGKALIYYKNALRIIPHEGDLYLERRIHSQLGGIYRTNRLFLHALREFKIYSMLSERIARLEPTDLNKKDYLWSKIALAANYRSLHILDTALMMYESIKPEVYASGDSALIYTFNVDLANNYLMENRPEMAIEILHNADLAVDDNNKNFILLSLAKLSEIDQTIYFNEKDLQDLLSSPSPLADKYLAAKALAEAAYKRNDPINMLKYVRLAQTYYFRYQKSTNDAALGQMEKIIDEQELENENMHLAADNKSSHFFILWGGMITVVVICILCFFYVKSRWKRIKLEDEHNRIREDDHQKIIALEQTVTELKNKVVPDEKLQQLRKIEEELSMAKIKEEIEQKLISSQEKPSEELFVRLRLFLAKSNPSLIEALDQMNLKSREYNDALMIRIKMSQKLIAVYLGITPQGVANLHRRLFDAWGKESGCKDWKSFIMSL